MPSRILLAEDNADSREITSLILSESGFEVVAAPTGRETLAIIEESAIDLVVLDYKLPDMSGIEVCNKIREANPDLPVVFFSASAHEADKKKALTSGAQAYLTKPDGLFTLPQTLEVLIAQQKSAQ
jgi:CheY-like chemotaxis protein